MLSVKQGVPFFLVFGTTLHGIEPLVSRTIGEHSNHHANVHLLDDMYRVYQNR